mmetsp:Transcript_54250/g.144712  ORF Transcript_54250/g.144712 Transcript_54250/m.144712 type:complete len:226 (+) Transcript_54250:306-983(+)
MLQVVANFLDLEVKKVLCVVHDENEEEQRQAQHESNGREDTNTSIQARYHTCRCNDSDDPNSCILDARHLVLGDIVFDPSKVLESDNDLNCAKSETGTNASNGHNNSKAINQIANPAPRVLAQNGVKTRAKCHGQVEAMPRQSHGDSYNQVRRPTGNAPVGNCHVEGKHVNLVLRAVSGVGVVVTFLMPERFGYAKDEQADSYTGGENHGKVGASRELGGLVLST